MPWLDKQHTMYFVHIPRTAGTSILTKHNIAENSQHATETRANKLGLAYFTYRSTLLELSNFPVRTWENIVAVVLLVISMLLVKRGYSKVACLVVVVAVLIATLSTFFLTAPVSMRTFNLFSKVLPMSNGWMMGKDYLYGLETRGLVLAHMTPQQLIRFGYFTESTWNQTDHFCIVRNPYARMVSIYLYNRFPCETFPSFVQEWISRSSRNNDMDPEYCHVYPQTAYTHYKGTRCVRYILRVEDLKNGPRCKNVCTTKGIYEEEAIPLWLADCIHNVPHTNHRASPHKQPWQSYFAGDTQLQQLVYETYRSDFETYGYPSGIS